MKPFFIAAALLALGCSPSAQGQPPNCLERLETAHASQKRRPLVILLESDPWAMVIGSDSPKLALYDDGQIIYRTPAGFRSVMLDHEELASFQNSLNISALACVLGKYEASDATDQPTETIFIGRGGRLASISAYGAPHGSAVPEAMTSAYQKLVKFDHPAAQQWLPEKVEVMVWPYEYAPQASIIWPADWPGFDSDDTIRRGESFSIFLPASEYPRLVEFLKGRNAKGAVEIGGKKWAADVRFPFPGEEEWMEINSEQP